MSTSQKAAAVLSAKPAEKETLAAPAAEAVEQVQAEGGLKDWSIVDGEWRQVSISSVVEPRDRAGFDHFAVPKSITESKPEFDFMHGGTDRTVMTMLRNEGWLPHKGKGGDGVEMKDGVPHVIGPDAPLMYRPKSVAHRYSVPSTEDLLTSERDRHVEQMNEITKEWARSDRTVDSNSLAYIDAEGVLELKTRLGNGDAELGQVLLNERAAAGIVTPDLERKGGKMAFQIPMSDDLAASLRAARQAAAALTSVADRIERGAGVAA